jgi:hypothetical protein
MQTYYVRAIWDEAAEVYCSETNVPGLNIEAATLPEFMDLAMVLGREMLEANVPGYSGAGLHPTASLELAVA